MIHITNTNVEGWQAAIRGMRNPLKSWANSDSTFTEDNSGSYLEFGEKDLNLMKKLANGGSTHAKYRRMINVTADITAPLYWWKEYDTYKVGTVANSESTMHTIARQEFTVDDFSMEHLIKINDIPDWSDKDSKVYVEEINGRHHARIEASEEALIMIDGDVYSPFSVLSLTIAMLNHCRDLYLKTKDKKYWWQLIQLLPSSYSQMRTVQVNYEVLNHMYYDRRDHKLDEWKKFCKWIKELPLANDIIITRD